MSDSTSAIEMLPRIDLRDVFISRNDSRDLADSAIDLAVGARDGFLSGLLDRGSSYHSENAGHFTALAQFQHALSRARIRNIGRVDPKSTADPLSSWRANDYHDQYSKLESRIRDFISFTAGWDGEQADEIPMNAIYDSLNFLDHVKRKFVGKEPNSAAPSPDGEIVLYWHGPGGYAEVNFVGDGNLTMCWGHDDADMEVIEEEHEVSSQPDQSRIWQALSDFLRTRV